MCCELYILQLLHLQYEITQKMVPLSLSSRADDGLDDFSQKLALINRQTENEGVIRDTEGKDDDDDDMITDKTDDVRVIVSLDGSPGDVDFGNR